MNRVNLPSLVYQNTLKMQHIYLPFYSLFVSLLEFSLVILKKRKIFQMLLDKALIKLTF